jgi:hypothetical protein
MWRSSRRKLPSLTFRGWACWASFVLPAVFFFQLLAELDLHRQRAFMYSGYIVAWVIYIGDLLLMAKLGNLKKEAAELAAEGQLSD